MTILLAIALAVYTPIGILTLLIWRYRKRQDKESPTYVWRKVEPFRLLRNLEKIPEEEEEILEEEEALTECQIQDYDEFGE